MKNKAIVNIENWILCAKRSVSQRECLYMHWVYGDNFSCDLPIEQVKFEKKNEEERGLNTIDDLINQIFVYRVC